MCSGILPISESSVTHNTNTITATVGFNNKDTEKNTQNIRNIDKIMVTYMSKFVEY